VQVFDVAGIKWRMRMGEGDLYFFSRLSQKTVSVLSVVAVTSLTLMKLGVGLFTQSLSLVSGALDSILDLVAMLVIFLTVRVANRPADYEYHYGRGKVENFSAFLVSLLLMSTSVWIFYEAVQRLFFKDVSVEVNVWAFLVMVVSMVVSYVFSRLLSRTAEIYGSQVFEAGALNFATDIWSSAIVLIGLSLTRLSQLWGVEVIGFGDAVAAMVVAGLVMRASLKISRSAVEVLLDRAPKGVADQLKKVIYTVRGVRECERVRVRRSGNKYFVDVTILLDPSLSLARASRVASEVEKKILKLLPGADVVIDTDPHRSPRRMIDRIRDLAVEEGFSIHGLTVRSINDRLHIDVHLEVPSDVSVEDASEHANRFEEIVKSEIPNVEEVNVHLEALEEDVVKSSESVVSEELVGKVREAVESFSVKFPKYEVEVKNYDGESNIYITIYVDGSMPLGEAYEISSELKDYIIRNLPSVENIIIDVEPYPKKR